VAVRLASTADAREAACAPRCASCRYRAEDRYSLEQSMPVSLFRVRDRASLEDRRRCRLHDPPVSAGDALAQFKPVFPN